MISINFYIKPLFKDTQICRCYPVAKKIRDYLGTFPKRGGGSPIPKTGSKNTTYKVVFFKKMIFFEEQKCSLGSKMQNKH